VWLGYPNQLHEAIKGISIFDTEPGLSFHRDKRGQHISQCRRFAARGRSYQRSSAIRSRKKPCLHWKASEYDARLRESEVCIQIHPACDYNLSSVLMVDRVHFDPERTIMVGDRLNTDILFGQNGGLTTLLVFTGSSYLKVNELKSDGLLLGITSEDEITGPNPSPIVPDFVTQALGDFRIVERSP